MRHQRFCRVGIRIIFGFAIALIAVAFKDVEEAAPIPLQSVAVLQGKILFEGTPPTPKRIAMNADPYCQQFTGTTEDYRVTDGGLENVMVYVSSAVNGTFPSPSEPVTLDQAECRFMPHVLTLQAGQKLIARNNNETAQNIHAWSQINPPFNVSLARRGAALEHVFDKAEPPFPIRCDVHNWEVAFVGVFSHPFHTVSRSGGAFELRLPPGEHQITAWHEKLGSSQQVVRVAPTDNPPLYFVFK